MQRRNDEDDPSNGAINQPLCQQRHGATGGQSLAPFVPGGTGNIQMRPALAFVKRERKQPAVMAPAFLPPMLATSAKPESS